MEHDVDKIIEVIKEKFSGVKVESVNPFVPGSFYQGLWFFNIPNVDGEIQIESSNGNCPFLVESHLNDDRYNGYSVVEVVSIIENLALTYTS